MKALPFAAIVMQENILQLLLQIQLIHVRIVL